MYFKKNRNNYSLISINQMPVSNTSALKEALTELNGSISEYGLFLTVKQINKLSDAVRNALIESGRIEIGAGIMPILAMEFCASVFVTPENYAELLAELVYIFFQVKTAVCDRVSDRDLVRLLKDYYENKAYGNVEIMRDRDIDLLINYIGLEMGDVIMPSGGAYDSDGYADERA